MIIKKEKLCDIECDDFNVNKGKTHGYQAYDDCYKGQLRYAAPVAYLRRYLEDKYAKKMIQYDVNDKLQNMFKQIILDADWEPATCDHDHGSNHANISDKKDDPEAQTLLPSNNKKQCCDH